MKNKFTKFIIATALGFGVITPIVGSEFSRCLAMQEATYEGHLTFDRFDIDTTIEIKATDKLKLNNVLYDIDKAILNYPSGLNVNSKSFSLNEYGEYTITMTSGDTAYCTKTFYVNGAYLTSSNAKTEISYGSLNAQFKQKGYAEGLTIKAVEGDFIRFAKPINVYENSITKLLYFNLVQMDQKVKNIDIRITDCYNPDLYLDILYKRGSKEILTYVSASAMGQRDYGLDKAENGAVVLDGENYEVSTFDGTIMDSNNPISGNYNNFMFYLDTSNKDRIRVIAETDIVYKKCIITEFNNPSIYSYTFPGFTNGNVYLSISANNFENVEYASIDIAEACGLKGEALRDLLGSTYNDDNAPIFISDLHESVHPIRSDVELKIPEIKVLDDTGLKGELDYTVWFNYDSNARSMMSVKDRRFTPKDLGFYTIIYSIEDYFGNVGEYRVDFVATSHGNDGISFTFEGLGDITTGKSYLLNKYKAESLNGEVDVNIEVTDPKGNVEILTNPTVPYMVKYAGKYKLKYLYSDVFYDGVYATTFDSVSNGKPLFDKEVITSSLYYIKGADYSIDYINAFVYGNDEPVKANVNAYVSYDGGVFIGCDRSKVTISGNSSVQFKYVANGDESTAIYSEVAEIVDVNYGNTPLNLGAYFDSELFTNKSSDDSRLNLKATANGDGSINFINKLYLSAFTTDFAISSDAGLDEFSVILSDYYDANNKIKVTFASKDGVSQYISINDEPLKYVDLNWKDCDIQVKYSGETSISVTLSKVISAQKVSYTYDLYNSISMSDEYLLLSFDVQNAKINDVVSIKTIMKQKFDKYVTEDENSPIATITNIETVQELGNIIKIPSFYYIDVLSPASELNAKLTARQISPITKILKSTNGQTLNAITNLYDDIEVVLDQFGQYQLYFDFVDGMGNKIKSTDAARIRPVISVLDEVAPTIVLSATVQKGGVNAKITPLAVTVSDNVTSEEDLNVYYFAYNQQGSFITSCKRGEQFTFTKTGEYKVYVYCTDEAGNSSFVTYRLIIE